MLRINQNSSAGGAKSYYTTADYYTEGQELAGQWRGEAARRLGLSGTIAKQDWDALCDNRHPTTCQTLTSRRNRDRSIGYDFNFHVPKSLSALYGITQDPRIPDVVIDCVDKTMADIEAEMKTRVRKAGKNEDRLTGNMVWGRFVHVTSRPVDGIPDPHVHVHCFVHNVTFDKTEHRWKAGQFRDLKRDAPYFEAVFHIRLARKMAEMGVAVERTKSGWEIAGLSPATLAKFSRRTALIEEEARKRGITNPSEKSELGAKTREHKAKNLTMDELRREWESRLTSDERESITAAASSLGQSPRPEIPNFAREAITQAAQHCFERKSVIPERELLANALKRSVGKSSLDSVKDAYARHEFLTADREGRRMITMRAVLDEEQRMIRFAREGRGSRPRMESIPHIPRRPWLNDGQKKAVAHILNSTDRVILVRGAAGTGKTTMMAEAIEAMQESGHRVYTFAPSAGASRGVLRKEGFENAETVARLLADPAMQEQVQNEVIWIDEAGLLGAKTMTQVFDLAESRNCRVILSGDRKQHGSVERGAALRLLETEAGLVPAEIKDIQRQQGMYKQAVEALSEGRTEDGFAQLNQLGWIKQCPAEERHVQLAQSYAQTVTEGKSALVVSPTHREADQITNEIRESLQQCRLLDKNQHAILCLQNANLTQAERGDTVQYVPGDVLVFHQNGKGHKKGDRIIVGTDPLPLDQSAKFTAYHAKSLNLAIGDIIRITRNGKTADGEHRLNNGDTFAIKGFTPRGDLILSNGWKVDKEFGHLDYGYVVTSHASQGKTVDRVFIGQSSQSFAASSREQFYVSVSRGRQQATVYTDDKAALLEAVTRSEARISASELVTHPQGRMRILTRQQLQQPRRTPRPIRNPRERERMTTYE